MKAEEEVKEEIEAMSSQIRRAREQPGREEREGGEDSATTDTRRVGLHSLDEKKKKEDGIRARASISC